jgi:hypothetical protein
MSSAAASGERMADLLSRIRQQASAPLTPVLSVESVVRIESPMSGDQK